MEINSESLRALVLRFNPVVSRQIGVVLKIQGSAGSGKSWLTAALLRDLKCRSQVVMATSSFSNWLLLLPRPKNLSIRAERLFARLDANELLEDEHCLPVLLEVLKGLAPFVLQIQDLHDALPERFEIIDQFIQKVPRLKGLGLVVTSRAALSDAFMVQPLSKTESDSMLETELGAVIPTECLDYIFARSAGHPLFSLEFLRYLTRLGSLWSDGKVWYWRLPTQGFMPVTVETLLENRFLEVCKTTNQRLVLEARALLRVPTEAFWQFLSGLTESDFQASKKYLEQQQILRFGSFVHPLFQEVIYGFISTKTQEFFRNRLVQASITDLSSASVILEKLTSFILGQVSSEQEIIWLNKMIELATLSGQPKFLARCQLWLAERQATDVDRFVELTDEVGLFDPKEAVRVYRSILEQHPDHLRAAASLGNHLCDQGRFEEAETLLHSLSETTKQQAYWLGAKTQMLAKTAKWHEVLALFEAHQEEILSSPDAYYVAHAAYILGDNQKALEITAAKTALEIEDFERAAYLGINSGIFLRSGKFPEALECLNRQVEMARKLPNTTDLITSLRSRAMILPRLQQFQEAYADLREALQLSLEIDDLMRVAHCQADLSLEPLQALEYQKAESLLLEADTAMAQFPVNIRTFGIKLSISELYVKWQPAHGLLLAQKYAKAALLVCDHTKIPRDYLLAYNNLAVIEAKLGNLKQAAQYAENAWGILQERQSPPEELAQCLRAKATIAEASGDTTNALELYRQAVQIAADHGHELLQKMSELEVARINKDPEMASQLRAWFETLKNLFMQQRCGQYFPELQPQQTIQNPASICLNVLGAVQIFKEGKNFAYRGRKRLEFLIVLLEARVAGATEISHNELTDRLYPDLSENDAKAALKQLVFQIRNSLGTNIIQSTPRGYALGEIETDAEQYLKTKDVHFWRDVYALDFPEVAQSQLFETLIRVFKNQLELLSVTDTNQTARLGQIYLKMEPYDRDVLELTLQALKNSGQVRTKVYATATQRFLELGEILPKSVEAFLGLEIGALS